MEKFVRPDTCPNTISTSNEWDVLKIEKKKIVNKWWDVGDGYPMAIMLDN